MLFTGLRIAVVNAIGTAVFASSVGGGGLGNLINTGIRRNDVAMILSGTAALMAMALLLDNLMAFCERRMGRRDSRRPAHGRRGGRPGGPSCACPPCCPRTPPAPLSSTTGSSPRFSWSTAWCSSLWRTARGWRSAYSTP